MNVKHFLSALLALLMALTAAFPAMGEAASASSVQQAETWIAGLLEGELTRSGTPDVQAWIDGPLAASAGQGSEWFILTLHQLQAASSLTPIDLTAYRTALEAFLAQGGAASASTRQKYALCMLASGGQTGVAETVETTVGQQGIMSWIYGLHLLNNSCTGSTLSPGEAAARLTALQLPDGGFALMGQTADVDVTAMALQALAPHRDDPAIAASVDAALALLSQRQQPNGGFASMGQANPESAAQVLIALCGLGIDPLTDERFLKNGHTLLDSFAAYLLPDGGYCHTPGGSYSAAATVQVFSGLTAYLRYAHGLPGLYVLDGTAGAETIAIGETMPAGEDGAYATGIIGGADGPTAMLIASPDRWKPAATAAVCLMAVIWCAVLLLRRKGFKNYLVVLLVTAALLGLILGLDIQRPEDYYGTASMPRGETIGAVTVEIRCDTLLGMAEPLPADGIILPKTRLTLYTGDTVYDVLTEVARLHSIQLDASGSEGMRYVVGLNHLYEQAFGELSGWMYLVNGETASLSCDQYLLKDGDAVSWQYTLEMGNDLK